MVANPALRLVTRCANLAEFVRVFCARVSGDVVTIPALDAPPEAAGPCRVVITLANRAVILDGDAELSAADGSTAVRFVRLDVRSRGLMTFVAEQRGRAPAAAVPRHLVPLGAPAGDPASASGDPSLAQSTVEPLGKPAEVVKRAMPALPTLRGRPQTAPQVSGAPSAAQGPSVTVPTPAPIPPSLTVPTPAPRPPGPPNAEPPKAGASSAGASSAGPSSAGPSAPPSLPPAPSASGAPTTEAPPIALPPPPAPPMVPAPPVLPASSAPEAKRRRRDSAPTLLGVAAPRLPERAAPPPRAIAELRREALAEPTLHGVAPTRPPGDLTAPDLRAPIESIGGATATVRMPLDADTGETDGGDPVTDVISALPDGNLGFEVDPLAEPPPPVAPPPAHLSLAISRGSATPRPVAAMAAAPRPAEDAAVTAPMAVPVFPVEPAPRPPPHPGAWATPTWSPAPSPMAVPVAATPALPIDALSTSTVAPGRAGSATASSSTASSSTASSSATSSGTASSGTASSPTAAVAAGGSSATVVGPAPAPVGVASGQALVSPPPTRSPGPPPMAAPPPGPPAMAAPPPGPPAMAAPPPGPPAMAAPPHPGWSPPPPPAAPGWGAPAAAPPSWGPSPTPLPAVMIAPEVGAATAAPAAAQAPRAAPPIYPTAQLPALDYAATTAPSWRRRPVVADEGTDMTEIIAVPRPRRRRWPVIVITTAIIVALAAIGLLAATSSSSDPAQAGPPEQPGKSEQNGQPGKSGEAGKTGDLKKASPAPAPEQTPDTATAPREATAPPPSGPCSVELTSSPDGAEVVVGGATVATTPATVDLPCATTAVRFTRDRYLTAEVAVTLRPGSQAVTARLERPTFRVRVTSRPSGAQVATADGRVIGTTPVTVEVVGYDGATLTVSKPGYATARERVVATRANQAVAVKLRRR
ncbi:MAG: PEGA domain-containing protein [Kofleriaceae bacterium]|nr:PEGA domain-containing protein [Kofleriaceae bacterium]MBP9168367.1 PEGA domain-containing protein [Kofleriaceae bacterium]MBP9857246.1 PEGA domain-containing protein [Kofleriaceae bacterium]